MSRIGVLPHSSRPQARELAPTLVRWLLDQGHQPHLLREDAEDFGYPKLGASREAFADLDLLVVLGGDGTMLHGIDLAGFAGVPVLGVNLGNLGFLTEVGPGEVYDALEHTLRGAHGIDERSTVGAQVVRADGTTEDLGEGINEVSVERGVGGKLIRMTLTLGEETFTTFGADGLIVATPTGSTAYAFSMRGPVVSPELRCLIVVAVGAHTLFDRPLVVAQEHEVDIAVRFGGRGVVLIDGRSRTEISEGDLLRATVGPSRVQLVRLGPDSYFTRLARRLGVPPT